MTRSKIISIALAILVVSASVSYVIFEAKVNQDNLESASILPGDVIDDPGMMPEVFRKDIERIEALLPSPTPVGTMAAEALTATWEELKDFSRPIEELVKEENAELVKAQIQARSQNLMNCLKVDLCGITKESPEETYFDDLHTPAHALLERLFESNLAVIEVTGQSGLSDELLLEAFSGTNETIQGLALEAYLSGSNEPAKIAEILAREDSFKGDGAAKLYQILLGTGGLSDESRAEVIERLSRKLTEGDPLTHIAIAESLQQLALTSSEAEILFPALCRFHNDSDNTQNWMVVRHHIKAIGLSPEECL